MKTIRFTVYGNQEDPRAGNPIPYTRTTQGQKWSPRYQRYTAWKTYVVAAYLDAAFPNTRIPRDAFGDAHDLLEKKPIKSKVRARINANIHFGKENHCDPDNVVKGLCDALFIDDKHVDVHTDHDCKNAQPHIEIEIQFIQL